MRKILALLGGLAILFALALSSHTAMQAGPEPAVSPDTVTFVDYDPTYCTTDPLAEPEEELCIGTPKPVIDPTCSPVPIPQMCPDHKNPSPPWPTDAQQRNTLAFLHNCIFRPPEVRTSYTPWAVVVTWGNGNTQWRKLPWAVLELYKDHWRSEANERFPDAVVGAWCGAAAH